MELHANKITYVNWQSSITYHVRCITERRNRCSIWEHSFWCWYKSCFFPFSSGNLMFSDEGKFDASVANQPENCSQRVIFMQSLFNQRSKNKQRPYVIDKAWTKWLFRVLIALLAHVSHQAHEAPLHSQQDVYSNFMQISLINLSSLEKCRREIFEMQSSVRRRVNT